MKHINRYKYRIYEQVYYDMISGKKTIEFRLLNDKTESMKIGDIIEFSVLDNDSKCLKAELVDKYIYDDVDELWVHKENLNNVLDYTKEEFESAMNNIFGEDKIKNSKIVGLKIKVKAISNNNAS